MECPTCRSRYDVSGRPAGTRARCRCGAIFALPEPTTSAGALSCPGCGAAVGSGAHECQFCRTELLVRACPRCFARIFHGHTHCPHCGVTVGVAAHANPDGSITARTCPACPESPALLARLIGDVLLDECSTCHGVWLDAAAVDRLVRERQERSLSTLRQMGAVSPDLADEPHRSAASPAPAGQPAAVPGQPPGRAMYIECPDCDQIMNRVNFARRSGIILDVCRAHGTWFDASELGRVVDFVMKGGVEDSQRREIEELREQARRAASDAAAARTRAAWAGEPGAEHRVELFGSALGLIGRLLR
ncbi:MAG TPA: zf-TFIIB domain-containing protein [Kofleriaceae bacterium]|nr:zf-TFIIB domain-containing protein [Kofleriaceae bacterium]